jgi:dynactin-4
MSCYTLIPAETDLSILQVVVPPKELVLAGKDAAAEYDELAEPQDFQDDPE